MSESRFLNSLRTQRSMTKDADWTLKQLRRLVLVLFHRYLVLLRTRMPCMLQPRPDQDAQLLAAWRRLQPCQNRPAGTNRRRYRARTSDEKSLSFLRRLDDR